MRAKTCRLPGYNVRPPGVLLVIGRGRDEPVGDRGEEEFLRHGERIGPYLTCLRGLAFEQGNRDWCERSAAILRDRRSAHAQR
ncbi:MAG TPA: hypothetical protein VIR33_04100 [Thermopolyspora sp.]